MHTQRPFLRRLAAFLSLAISGAAVADLAPPTGVAATDGTLTNAVGVSWSAVDGAAGYRIYRKMGPQQPMMIGVSATTNFNDLQAMPGTSFEYTVRAYAGPQQSAPSQPDTGWRNVPAPVNLTASDGTQSNGVSLQWIPSPGAQGYRVYRGVGEGELAEIAAPNQPGFLDATAVVGTVYTYVVRARTTPGNSAPSNADTGFRGEGNGGGGGGGAPPTGVSATDGTRTDGVAITWNAVANATGYRVYRGGGPGAPVEIGTPTEASYLDTTANAGFVYSYSVRSRFESGDSAASMPNGGWRNVPAPTNLAATDGTVPNGVGLTWNAVPGSIGYRVFRSMGATPPIQIAQTNAPTHLDATAAPGVTYTYLVRARTPAGDSMPSEPDTGFRAEAVPGQMTASDGRSTQAIEVRWNPIPGVAGYRVFRGLTEAELAEIAAPNGPFFNDAGAVPGTVYAYRVCGRNADGSNTTFSNVDTGWRNVPAPMGLQASDGTSTAAVNLTWAAVPGATGYRVFRQAGPGEPTEIGAPEGTTFADESALPGLTYLYRVCARTSPGNSRFSHPNSGWRNVAAPTGVAATDGAFSDKVVVTWTPSDVAAVNGYAIFRQLEGQPNAVPVGMVQGGSTATFNDVTIPVSVVGTYSVRARTVSGLSAAGETDTGFRSANSANGDGNVASGGDGDLAFAGEKLPPAAPLAPAGERPATGFGGASPVAPGTGASDVPERLDAEVAPADACDSLARRLAAVIAALELQGDRHAIETSILLAELALDPKGVCRMAAGDVNRDGSIDATDLVDFLEASANGDLVHADLNRDGSVDELDLALFASAYVQG